MAETSYRDVLVRVPGNLNNDKGRRGSLPNTPTRQHANTKATRANIPSQPPIFCTRLAGRVQSRLPQ